MSSYSCHSLWMMTKTLTEMLPFCSHWAWFSKKYIAYYTYFNNEVMVQERNRLFQDTYFDFRLKHPPCLWKEVLMWGCYLHLKLFFFLMFILQSVLVLCFSLCSWSFMDITITLLNQWCINSTVSSETLQELCQ